jgi:DNA invertase Pin-like site-specific DNA recombinase
MQAQRKRRVALYLRVSTANKGQTVQNQRLALDEVAARSGWDIVAEFADHASGAKGRDKRPGLDALMKAATRREFDRVAVWALDRLGRSMQHLVGLINDLHALGIDVYAHAQHLDTSTTAGKALFYMSGIFAEIEREMIRDRVHAGLDRARKRGKRLGRPKVSVAIERQIRDMRAEGVGMVAIGRHLGIGTGTVARVLREQAAA